MFPDGERRGPQRISPKHAAILVTRPADKITDEQQLLMDRIATQCPEVIDLRRISLGFHAALIADDSNQLRDWVEGAKHSEFGPVVRFTNHSKVTPFAHALFGGVHGSASSGSFGAGETDFSWAAGGGIDVGLNHRFAVRLAQADFLQTRFGSTSQNNFRYSAGIVIKF